MDYVKMTRKLLPIEENLLYNLKAYGPLKVYEMPRIFNLPSPLGELMRRDLIHRQPGPPPVDYKITQKGLMYLSMKGELDRYEH